MISLTTVEQQLWGARAPLLAGDGATAITNFSAATSIEKRLFRRGAETSGRGARAPRSNHER